MSDRRERAPFLVLGLGNVLLTDDGVGLEVLRLLTATPLGADPRFELVDGGTQGIALAGLFEDREAVLLLDAEQRGAPPGTVHVSDATQLAGDARGGTAHECNAAELLAVVRFVGASSAPVHLVGIEPQEVRTGHGLTPPVLRALPRALKTTLAVLARLTGERREVTPCTS